MGNRIINSNKVSFRKIKTDSLYSIDDIEHAIVFVIGLSAGISIELNGKKSCLYKDNLAVFPLESGCLNIESDIDGEFALVIVEENTYQNIFSGLKSELNIQTSIRDFHRGYIQPSSKLLLSSLFALSGQPSADVLKHYEYIVIYHLVLDLFSKGEIKTEDNDISYRLVSLIKENCKRNISIDDLADYIGVSRKVLYSIFKSNFDMTPITFINNVKLDMAFGDISSGRKQSVTDVAIDYGFNNTGRFSNLYRKRIGEMPSETKKKARFA